MLLNRLVTALRRQDWITVFLEFSIVVAGIFVGLQVNEWADRRQERRDEIASLERLLEESKDAFVALDRQIGFVKRLNGMRRQAVQFVDSDAAVPDEELPLKIGINTISQYPPASPVTLVYDELKFSGRLQLLRSSDLRFAIADFYENLAWHDRLAEEFRISSDSYFVSYREHVYWNYNAEATDSDILLSTYDWASLRADKNFKTELIGLLRNQLVLEENLIMLREQAKSLCASISEEIKKTCDLSTNS